MTTTTPATTYTIEYDAEDDCFDIYDEDGDLVASGYDSEEEAEADRAEYEAEAAKEAQEEALESARDEIKELLDGCEDAGLLGRIKAMLGG